MGIADVAPISFAGILKVAERETREEQNVALNMHYRAIRISNKSFLQGKESIESLLPIASPETLVPSELGRLNSKIRTLERSSDVYAQFVRKAKHTPRNIRNQE